MTASETLSLPPQSPSTPRTDAQTLLRSLDELSQQLQPGDPLPTQLELVRQYNASERAVRWALDELRRQGKVVSRRRVGTVVADRSLATLNGYQGQAGSAPHLTLGGSVDSRTIVAIATPGQSVFDRALHLLFHQAEAGKLSLLCRLFSPAASNIPQGESPLGYMLFGRELLPLANQLQAVGHRVVLVGTPYADAEPEVPCVYGDQEHGGYLATRHLLDLGHRRIAFRGNSDWQHMRRWRGHQQALAEARVRGLEVTENNIFEEQYEQWRRNPELAAAYFRESDASTAVVAWNDQMAMSLLSLLSYVGVRVPHDVSLIGYDDLPASQQVHPQLTTIDIALEQQLRVALRLLTQPEKPSPTQQVMVTSNLIRRDSTAVLSS